MEPTSRLVAHTSSQDTQFAMSEVHDHNQGHSFGPSGCIVPSARVAPSAYAEALCLAVGCGSGSTCNNARECNRCHAGIPFDNTLSKWLRPLPFRLRCLLEAHHLVVALQHGWRAPRGESRWRVTRSQMLASSLERFHGRGLLSSK